MASWTYTMPPTKQPIRDEGELFDNLRICIGLDLEGNAFGQETWFGLDRVQEADHDIVRCVDILIAAPMQGHMVVAAKDICLERTKREEGLVFDVDEGSNAATRLEGLVQVDRISKAPTQAIAALAATSCKSRTQLDLADA